MADASEFGPRLRHPTATIADSGTTSGAVDLYGCTLCGLYLPSGFDGTNLSFTACDTAGGTFVEVQDGEGAAVALTVAASKYVKCDPAVFAGIRFLKLVADAQTGAATITLAVRPV